MALVCIKIEACICRYPVMLHLPILFWWFVLLLFVIRVLDSCQCPCFITLYYLLQRYHLIHMLTLGNDSITIIGNPSGKWANLSVSISLLVNSKSRGLGTNRISHFTEYLSLVWLRYSFISLCSLILVFRCTKSL